ncbi:hypothetical protein T484DRAFT_1977014 [Baffinella frigidus]|nr:hypothetical protein T484DRAFT_1977014 [Cryptophyta sp. CCMP2293]
MNRLFAPSLRAAGRSLLAAQKRPAQRRLMSTAPASGIEPGSFYALWVLPEVLPIIFCISAACGLVMYQVGSHGTIHEDVTWTKKEKKRGVAANYEDKYPGTESACRAGAQKMDHH